jgi:hypothetical protein
MKMIEPSFEIDDKGRTICVKHTKYLLFKEPNQSFSQEIQREALLTCKSCEHYMNDDCYFPRSQIDLIEKKKRQTRLKCHLCGELIHRPLTIIQSLYYEKNYNIKLPLVCCVCNYNLRKDNFMRNMTIKLDESLKKVMISSLVIFTCFIGIPLILIFFTLFASMPISTISILFIPIFTFGAIFLVVIVNNMKKLWNYIKGKKYYQKFFTQLKIAD